MSTQNILLKSSCVIISDKIHIDKYKLEMYKNGNIRIINETSKTDYFYIEDYIEIIQTIVNMYISLFKTICDINQLDNFIIGLQMVKKNLKTDFDRIKSKKVNYIEGNSKEIRIECDHLQVIDGIDDSDSENISHEELLHIYKKIKSENKSLKNEIKILKNNTMI